MLKNVMTAAMALIVAAGAASGALSNTRINEIDRNPNGNDDVDYARQYVELINCTNTSLAGLAVVIVVDDGTTTEIDEAMYIPASSSSTEDYKTDGNGLFVFWNSFPGRTGGVLNAVNSDLSVQANASTVYGLLPAGMQANKALTAPTGSLNNGDFVGNPPTNIVVRHEASFQELRIQNGTGEDAGIIGANGSMTMFLIDVEAWRTAYNTFHSTSNTTQDMLNLIQKDDVFDANRDGTPETIFTEASWLGSIIDEVGASDGGGHEYTKYEGHEIDFTPAFNPDAFIRLNYVAPGNIIPDDIATGGRLISWTDASSVKTTDDYRTAYTEWVVGDLKSGNLAINAFALGATIVPAANTTVDQADNAFDSLSPNFEITPGSANYTTFSFNVSGGSYNPDSSGHPLTGCAPALRFDRDGDGSVTVSDVQILLQGGDTAGALEAAGLVNN